MKFFVSYAPDEKDEAHPLAVLLQGLGGEVKRGWEATLDEIEACEGFVAILTPRSVASVYCAAERAYARALNKPFLLLMLAPCDLPLDLQEAPYEDVTDLALDAILARIRQALDDLGVWAMQGAYPTPAIKPARPPMPEPEARPEHAAELLAAAREAAESGDETLASRLYQKVYEADPGGLGAEAASRLADLRYARSRGAAYAQVERLVKNPTTREGARAAWRVYVARYGRVYDPNNYANLLADPLGQTAPLSPDRLPPESTLLTVKTARLSDYGVAVPPPLEWCAIPAGEVTLEEKVYPVEAFQMGKFPVTNGQFQGFVEAPDGFAEATWWDFSEEARAWRAANPAPAESKFGGERLPRENVCWFEAIAFCRWLSAQTSLPISLPTEMQWQRAAQGDDGRAYPWGAAFDPARCNTFESAAGQTSPVDGYPGGASPYGVLDMSGNVWEWCRNVYDAPDALNLEGAYSRSVRGGSWRFKARFAGTAFRGRYKPAYRHANLGFRIACFRA